MQISLDVLMRLGQIALIVAGVIALIYLVLLFKSLMDTFHTLRKTLDALTVDLIKLETPLQTVGQLSETVDEVSGSAKRAAMTAINVFSESTGKFSGMLNKKKKAAESPASPVSQAAKETAEKADFQPVGSESAGQAGHIHKEQAEYVPLVSADETADRAYQAKHASSQAKES